MMGPLTRRDILGKTAVAAGITGGYLTTDSGTATADERELEDPEDVFDEMEDYIQEEMGVYEPDELVDWDDAEVDDGEIPGGTRTSPKPSAGIPKKPQSW